MNRISKFGAAAWALAGVIVLIQACNGSGSNAVAAATGWAPYLVISAPNAQQANMVASESRERLLHKRWGTFSFVHEALAAGTTTCPGIGTLNGYPSQSDPIQAQGYAGVSCSGYYYDITPAPTSNDKGVIFSAPGNAPVSYDAPGCVGNAYVRAQGFGTGALAQGVVFRADPKNIGPTDASTYLYVPKGEATATVNVMSAWQLGFGCTAASVTLPAMYAALPNDPAVTGVSNAPVPGPISTGTP